MERFSPFELKMRAAGLPELAIASFRHYYGLLVAGESGLLPEESIEPVTDLPSFFDLPESAGRTGRELTSSTVMLKLNGGLGTSMGLDRAKSLLTVKEGLSFLDIIVQQALLKGIPLLLMNSFATHEDSIRVLRRYSSLDHGLPLAFLQHRIPKVDRRTLAPVEYPEDPELEWCPPGHGDIYGALMTSGMLDKLLDSGIRYAFVSNSDNLGAVLDPCILGYFAAEGLPFMMEAARRSESDRKGGHLARLVGDSRRLVLRESAQCPDEDEAAFQNTERHRFFNTNNLWIDLEKLAAVLREESTFLKLPMIRNSKSVDPRNPDSPPVFQLETAMGAAISMFEDACALEVPRHRFAPVKTCSDLLAVRSDATILTEDFRIIPNPERIDVPLIVELDPRFYGLLCDLEARFPTGFPSLLRCASLRISGDILLGSKPRLRGDVELINRADRQLALTEPVEIEGLRVFE